MEFRVLGPLEVGSDETSLPLGSGKERALLAILILNANQTVARDRLVDDLWGERAPESAAKAVQTYVSRLRKRLPAGILRTRPPGYVLELEPEQLDLHRFERLLAAGQGALADGSVRAGLCFTTGGAGALARAGSCGVRVLRRSRRARRRGSRSFGSWPLRRASTQTSGLDATLIWSVSSSRLWRTIRSGSASAPS